MSTESTISSRRAHLSDAKKALLERRLRGRLESMNSSIDIQKRDVEDSVPLSFGQQRLWYLDQLEPDSPAYNLPSAFRIKGPLNINALRQSLSVLVRRHEALRTTLVVENGKPVQKIAEPETVIIDLPVIDCRTISFEEREKRLKDFLISESMKPFNLAVGPLVIMKLIQLQSDENVLFFMTHHSVFDGRSFRIFQSELHTEYNSQSSGVESDLPNQSIQYADFSIWQREQLKGKKVSQQLSYWKNQLNGDLPVLELPTDFSRPPAQSFNGSRISTSIPGSLVKSLQKIASQTEATLFMILLSAYYLLLYRYSSQEDICIGTPIANRNHTKLENMIGFLVNTIVLRIKLEGNPTFHQLLKHVRMTCLDSFSNQDIPFERLVQDLAIKRDLSRTPLYQTMFFLLGPIDQSIKKGSISWQWEKIDHHATQTDLSLWVWEASDGLEIALEYCTDLFKNTTIKKMLENFIVLLNGIAANPESRISDLPLLSENEKKSQKEWNETEADYRKDACLHHLFESQAMKTPDMVAAVHGDNSITYAELNQRAESLASYLAQHDVEPGVFVGICIERSLNMLVGLLGILKAGGAYVPIDPDYPAERISYMFENSGIKVLLTQSAFVAGLPAGQARVVCMDTEGDEIFHPLNGKTIKAGGFRKSQPEDLAYVIYTSGSTGQPKGVKVPHRAVVNFLSSMAFKPGMTAQDTLLAVTTLSFDIAVLELFLPLTVGAKTVIASHDAASDGMQLLDLLNNSDVTVMQATPSTWRLLLAAGWEGSEKLKILCGGEAFPRDLVSTLLKRTNSLWNMYGPTETTVWSTCFQIQDTDGPILIGKPISNTKLYVLDKHLQPLPVGVPGELYIGGAGVTHGYLNRPELTEKQFVKDPFQDDQNAFMYRTGDLVKYHSDGNLEYFNRLDNQVKVRGFRIELGEIETVLSELEDVRQSIVAVREDRPGDTRLVAYFVPQKGQSITPTAFRQYLRKKLPDYMVPQHFIEVNEMPLTPAGKIDRKGIVSLYDFGIPAEEEYVPPGTEPEKRLAKIWMEVLGIERVGVHDNFFDIGGHSLLAMQAIAKIKSEMGVYLNPRIILLNTLGQITKQFFSEAYGNDIKVAEEKKVAETPIPSFSLLQKIKSKIFR